MHCVQGRVRSHGKYIDGTANQVKDGKKVRYEMKLATYKKRERGSLCIFCETE